MKKISRILALTLAITLIASPLNAVAAYTDLAGRPESRTVDRWSNYGILEGWDGIFNPEGEFTRAQMAALLQRLMQHPTAAANTYTDVPDNAWYTEDVLKSTDLGVMEGSNHRFMPMDALTREMAVTTIARAFDITENPDLSSFSDNIEVSLWAAPSVGAMAAAGYITPYSDGTFKPKQAITRMEMVMLLDAMFDGYYHRFYTNSNTIAQYYRAELSKNALLNTPNAAFSFQKIAGNFYLTSGVSDSDVVFNNLQLDGTLYVNGGKKVSLLVTSLETADTAYSSWNSASGTSLTDWYNYTAKLWKNQCNNIVVTTSSDFELFALHTYDIQKVNLAQPDGRNSLISATIGTLELSGNQGTLSLQKTSVIDHLLITGTGNQVAVGSASVKRATVEQPANFLVFSNISTVRVEKSGSGTTFMQKPYQLILAPGATVQVVDKTYTNTGTTDMAV